MPDQVESEETKCSICGQSISSAELCQDCAKGNEPFGPDLEATGGWAVQDGRTDETH